MKLNDKVLTGVNRCATTCLLTYLAFAYPQWQLRAYNFSNDSCSLTSTN